MMKSLNDSMVLFVLRHVAPILLVVLVLALLVSPYAWLAPVPGIGVLMLLWIAKRNLLPWLFYGFVALIPFGAYRGLRGEFGFLRLHWVFAASLALLVGLRILLLRRTPDEVRSPAFWGRMLLFYLVNVLALLASKVLQTSVAFMILLAAGYLLVALGMILLDRDGFEKTLPAVVVGSVFVSALMAVAGSVFRLPWFVSGTTGRVLGGAPDPNNMSLMVIFSLPFALYFLLTTQQVVRRLFLLLIITVDIIAVIATFSRGGALILTLTVFLMLWEFRHMIAPRNLGLLLGVAGLTVAALIVLTPESYQQRISSLKAGDDFAMRRRFSYLVVARDLITDRPLIGNGPDSYSSLYAKSEVGQFFRREGESGERDAHNTYFSVATGSGILGLVFFLSVLFYAMKSFSRAQWLFEQVGNARMGLLVRVYRTAYLILLVYLLIYSDVLHKYLLLSLAVSQVALRFANSDVVAQETEHA